MNNKKIYKLLYLLFICTLGIPTVKAQQDPMYSQYMFNTLPINPAYAGSREMLSIVALGRQQWVGFDGAPSTATLSLHSPFYKSMAGGASIVYDTYGPVKQTSFFVDYAYHLKVADAIKLSLGLSGGFNHHAIDYNSLSKQSIMDNAYLNAAEQMLLPNFGFGMFLYSNKFYLGLSVPRIIENKYTDDSYGHSKEVRHYYAMAGYVLQIKENLALRPSTMIRMSEAAPFSIDINLNAILYDKFWVGAMYRWNDAFGGMLQYQLSSQLKVGYAFDMSSNELSVQHSGSHEVMINYEFNFKKRGVYNPRYF